MVGSVIDLYAIGVEQQLARSIRNGSTTVQCVHGTVHQGECRTGIEIDTRIPPKIPDISFFLGKGMRMEQYNKQNSPYTYK